MRVQNCRLMLEPTQAFTKKAQYQYQPLQSTDNDIIRILTLNPGQLEDPLRGALEAVPIDSAGIYEVVSYVWTDPGPRASTYNIMIRNDDGDEGLLELRGGSIFAALSQSLLTDRPRRIWAEQCCT